MQTKPLTWLILFLLFALSLLYIYQINTDKDNILYKDYGKFYQATQFAMEGKSIYTRIYLVINPKPSDHGPAKIKKAASMLNPPFFILVMLPLGYLSYTASLWIWSVLCIGCGVFSVLLIEKTLNFSHTSWNLSLGLLLAFFAYYPTFTNFQYGQVTLLLLPFEVGGWLAARNGNPRLSGILLGIAASLKPFFGLFLLYFLLRREWRGLAWLLGTILICSLLAGTVFGFKTYPEYHSILQHIAWYSSSWNASILGFLVRLFGGDENNVALIPIAGISHPLFMLLSVFLTASLIPFFWPDKKIAVEKKRDLDFSITIVAMLLLSPFAWLYYFPLLIVPVVVLLRIAEEKKSITLYMLTCISLLLSGFPHLLIIPSKIINANVIPVFIISSCTVAILALLLMALFLARRILLHHPHHTGKLVLDKVEWIALYAIVLLPSLLSILKVINTTALFGQTVIPDFTSSFFGS